MTLNYLTPTGIITWFCHVYLQ